MNTSASLKRSPLTFFVLVFALSLPFWLLGPIAEHFIRLPFNLPVSALQFVCPIIAALILVYRGLYFLGLPWLYKRKSSLLCGVGEDAAFTASAIVDRD